ncbi:Ionotropic receptor 93a-like 10, partial [Homarus americanus]
IIRGSEWRDGESGIEAAVVVHDCTGMLLGQNLPRRLPRTNCRVLVATWLVFLVIGTAYRGNSTALTLPKYPPELRHLNNWITMPPYGAEFKNFFSNSDSQVPKLAERIHFVPSAVVGQQEAIQNKQAHLENRRYQQLKIAQRFTKTDGTPKLYIGRDSILPGQAAWPIPHDAPYRPVLDRSLMAVIEAGLYEKWSKDLLFQVQMNTRRRQQQQQWAQQEEEEESQKTFRQLASRLSHHHTPAGSIFAPPFGLWPCRTCLYYGGLSHVAFTEKCNNLIIRN